MRGSPFGLVPGDSVNSEGDSERDEEPKLREDGGLLGPNGVLGGTKTTCSREDVGCWNNDTFEFAGDC